MSIDLINKRICIFIGKTELLSTSNKRNLIFNNSLFIKES